MLWREICLWQLQLEQSIIWTEFIVIKQFWNKTWRITAIFYTSSLQIRDLLSVFPYGLLCSELWMLKFRSVDINWRPIHLSEQFWNTFRHTDALIYMNNLHKCWNRFTNTLWIFFVFLVLKLNMVFCLSVFLSLLWQCISAR